jgi:hypothetical protein
MKSLVEMISGICDRCKKETAQKTIDEYPVTQILWYYENRGLHSPMYLGTYEYNGKKYRIDISVREEADNGQHT